MSPSLEETIILDFITSSSTGAATDADSTPTAEVFEDATDTAILTPTVTKRTSKTGNYRIPVACTAVNGFEAGKSYNVIASATIGGIAAKCKVGSFQVRTRDTDDLLATTGYTAPDNTSITAIKAKTDNLPALPAAVGNIPLTDQIADRILGRRLNGGADGVRTVGQALAASRNKVVRSGNSLTVYDIDDTTILWTAVITTAPGAELITSVDPA